MRSFFLGAAALTFGCTENPLDAGFVEGPTKQETADDGGTDDTSIDEAFVAAWYTLEASVVVEDGAGSITDATVELVTVDEGLVRDPAPCALDLAEFSVVPPPSGDAELMAWWSLSVQADDTCVPDGVPAILGFGLGKLDVEVRARLGTVNLEDQEGELYGAWLSADEGATLFPFGYATAPEDMTDLALPDGAYALKPLLLLALPAPE